jgi:hypothetical protein
MARLLGDLIIHLDVQNSPYVAVRNLGRRHLLLTNRKAEVSCITGDCGSVCGGNHVSLTYGSTFAANLGHVEHGLWSARSAEFLQTDMMNAFAGPPSAGGRFRTRHYAG